MTSVDINKTRFQERVTRINSGKQWQADNVLPRHVQLHAKRKPGQVEFGPRELGIISLALALGMVVVFVARLVVFKAEASGVMPKELAQLGGKNVLLLAGLLAFFCIQFFGMKKGFRLHATVLGCALMFYGESHIAMQAPGLWSGLFSQGYVTELAAKAAASQIAL